MVDCLVCTVMGGPLTAQDIIHKGVASLAEKGRSIVSLICWLRRAPEASGARWWRREDRGMCGGEEGEVNGCGARSGERRERGVAFIYCSFQGS